MRSKRLRIGVALAVCSVAALAVTAAWATGASHKPALKQGQAASVKTSWR